MSKFIDLCDIQLQFDVSHVFMGKIMTEILVNMHIISYSYCHSRSLTLGYLYNLN